MINNNDIIRTYIESIRKKEEREREGSELRLFVSDH